MEGWPPFWAKLESSRCVFSAAWLNLNQHFLELDLSAATWGNHGQHVLFFKTEVLSHELFVL